MRYAPFGVRYAPFGVRFAPFRFVWFRLFSFQRGNYEALDLTDLPSIQATQKQGSVAMFDPVFGPVGRSPLEKETVLDVQVGAGSKQAPKLLHLSCRVMWFNHHRLFAVVCTVLESTQSYFLGEGALGGKIHPFFLELVHRLGKNATFIFRGACYSKKEITVKPSGFFGRQKTAV